MIPVTDKLRLLRLLNGVCAGLLVTIGLSPLEAQFTEYPLPNSAASGIIAGPDGALWFTENSGGPTGGKIGRITTSGAITEYLLPTAYSTPAGITAGPDGALWFTEQEANQVGRITMAGSITEYALPTANSYPSGITAGPDGALWFTENFGGKIGRITTSGSITEYSLPTANSYPSGIAAGPDGALWFTENSNGKIGRISTSGAITEYPTSPHSSPYGITAGPDSALWFIEQEANQIGRITTSGSVTEYPLLTALSIPYGITAGPDGALWFTEGSANQIGRITTSGSITEYPLPTAYSLPIGITAGPDGGLWFTEPSGGKIGRCYVTTADMQVAVPNVIGMTSESAGSAITNAGLVVQTIIAASTVMAAGSVISETPAAGSLANLGTAVILVISSSPVQYQITFTTTSGSPGPTGSFSYDASRPVGSQFTNFFIGWAGLGFDLTSSANTPGINGAQISGCLPSIDSAGVFNMLQHPQLCSAPTWVTAPILGSHIPRQGFAISPDAPPTLSLGYITIGPPPLPSTFNASGSWTGITASQVALPVSLAPSLGSAGRQVFTFVARDTLGASHIQYAQFLFTKSGLSAQNACYISYDPIANVFYLLSDDMTAWYGLLGGSANTIGNAQCTIYGATSGSTKVGADLTTTVDISFRSGFAGDKTIYEFSGDILGNVSGWFAEGTWNDTGDSSEVEVTSLSPLPGSGFTQTLTATVKDGAGAGTITFVQFVTNTTLNGINACYIHYDRASNVFFLLNDAGTEWFGLVAGSATLVSNSQCTLHGAGSGGSPSGSTLTIRYALDFAVGFAGTKQIYMQAVDAAGNIEVWHKEGTDNP